MNSLLEIEAAIAKLPLSDVRKLATWLESYLEVAEDIEMEADIRDGRIDRVIQRAKDEFHIHRHD